MNEEMPVSSGEDTGSMLSKFAKPLTDNPIGFAIDAGLKLKEMLEDYTKNLEKITEELDKQSAASLNEEKSLTNQIRSLDSLAGAETLRSKILDEIATAQENARFATDDQKDAYEQQTLTLEAQLRILDSQRDKIGASQTAAENLKKTFADDATALQNTLQALDQIKDKQNEQLDFENEKAALIKNNALEELKQQLDLGKITEAQYNERKGDIEVKSEKERSSNKIKSLENEVNDLKARQEAAQANYSQKITESNEVSGLQEFFAKQRGQAQTALSAIDTAALALEAAQNTQKRAENNLLWLKISKQNSDMIQQAQAELYSDTKQTAQASAIYNKLNANRETLTTTVQATQKTYDSLTPYVTEYKKNEEEALAKQREALATIPPKIDAAKMQIEHEKELQALREKGAATAAQNAKIEQDKKDNPNKSASTAETSKANLDTKAGTPNKGADAAVAALAQDYLKNQPGIFKEQQGDISAAIGSLKIVSDQAGEKDALGSLLTAIYEHSDRMTRSQKDQASSIQAFVQKILARMQAQDAAILQVKENLRNST